MGSQFSNGVITNYTQGCSKGRAAGAAALYAKFIRGADLGLVFLIFYLKNRINDEKGAPWTDQNKKFALHVIISINKLYFWDRGTNPCRAEAQNFLATALTIQTK